MSDSDCVRVAVRIRPLVKNECDKGCKCSVDRIANEPQVLVNKTDSFTFNYVFDENDSQERVYRDAVYGMLDSLFKGYNVTILAYGQTGSGKTHTMGTAYDGNDNSEAGVIPRAMVDIFQRINHASEEYDFTVTCSFMELYQEQVFDLLCSKPRDQSIIEVREDRNRIIMPDLTEEVVRSAQETTDCLMRGSTGRAVASTAMNEQSSRSHAIFTLTLKAAKKDDMKGITTSKFHLVDLAGSERSKKTKATGDRFKEGVKINQGLLALGNVISALGTGNGSGYVGYRDSKLTRLLQDSLGGNSVTLMIACISPADYNIAETLSTLRYADRARKIKNKPIINQDPHAAEINRLTAIIQKLRMELLSVGGSMSSSISSALQTVAVPTTETLNCNGGISQVVSQKMYQELQEKYRNSQRQLQATLHDVAESEMRAHIAESAHEQLKTKADEIKTMLKCIGLDVESDKPIGPEKIEAMRKLVEDINDEIDKTQTEISEHKRVSTMNISLSSDGDDDGDVENHSQEMNDLIQEQADVFTNKQMNFKDQLRRINRELDLKEELHQRVAVNLSKFYTLDDKVEEKFQECAAKINELEVEKCELIEKLKHVAKENASAKLAEERRKRLQTLEQEITDMKRKNMQQAKLLKVREKEAQKIKNLHAEIQAMKQSKVKLIRAMRQESDNFRQWKLSREKELIQLKCKDRKMQSEMARKEALHTKQRNVLKRKCEEAQAVNKRLKEALERQKVAQSQRQKQHSLKDINITANKVEQVITWVERELEVITSLIDAENSLEQLMEDRGIVSNRIEELRQQRPLKNTPQAAELAQLEEELEMRSAQIADIQQKVCANDLESRMCAIYDTMQSLAEARAVIKHLLVTIIDMRRDYGNKLQEQKTAREAADERCQTTLKRMRLMRIEHEEQMAEKENAYEEKIAFLLRELHNTPQLLDHDALTPEQLERVKIQEEQLGKMDSMREELEEYKKLVNELQEAVETLSKKRISKKTEQKLEENIITEMEISSSSEEEENNSDDPDWKQTPICRKARRTKHQRNCKSDISVEMDETNSTNSNSTFNGTATAASNRKGFGQCKCRGNCSTKRCGCYSIAQSCSMNCRCSEKCTNGRPVKSESIEDNEENKTDISKNENNLTSSKNLTVPVSETALITPKVPRPSYLSFETASAKKKFFD